MLFDNVHIPCLYDQKKQSIFEVKSLLYGLFYTSYN